jgi:hypothetical protein
MDRREHESLHTGSDLALVSGVSAEQGFDLEPVDPAAERTSESSVPAKIDLREPFSNDMSDGFDYQFFHQKPLCASWYVATLGHERSRGRGKYERPDT